MACHAGLSQESTLSPLLVAFVSDGECDTIYVAHSLSVIPGDVTSPTTLDGHILGLVGDEPSAVALRGPHTNQWSKGGRHLVKRHFPNLLSTSPLKR
jgi:hypothetical protein